jgi:ubiquitin carboxyl-terminal hydrolase 22/27/51
MTAMSVLTLVSIGTDDALFRTAAVTCGSRARIYCFSCGDFVHHEVFTNEKHRIDVMETLPWMAWPEHAIHRSFDALQFVHIPDVGIIWKGMKATYPILVAKDHVRATQLCRERYILFHGEVDQLPPHASRDAVELARQQQTTGRCWLVCRSYHFLFHRHQRWYCHFVFIFAERADRHRIPAPVGLYNLGNTCFMSAILHCLIHCVPLQQYFIRDVGHHHLACQMYRTVNTKPVVANARDSSAKAKAKLKTVCLACEMDKMFLRYMGSALGIDLLSIVDASSSNHSTTTVVEDDSSIRKKDCSVIRGSPLLTAEMLAASWKCGGMNHLAGYEQRDAHEFLHGFLETLGKHMRQYRERVRATVHAVQTSKPFANVVDEKTSNGTFVPLVV